MAFIEVQFPAIVSEGAVGGPGYQTQRVTTQSGRIYRNARWSLPLYKFQAETGIKEWAQYESVLNLFHACRGGLDGFRFKDPRDFKSCVDAGTVSALDQNIGTGDGTTAAFQLRKGYTAGSQTTYRTVKKPVAGTVRVAVAGTEKTITTHFTVDTTTGIITFTAGNIPTAGQAITAGYEFDIPMMFESDDLPVVYEEADLGALNIPLIEDRNA